MAFITGVTSETSEYGSWYARVRFPSGTLIEQAGWPSKEKADEFADRTVASGDPADAIEDAAE